MDISGWMVDASWAVEGETSMVVLQVLDWDASWAVEMESNPRCRRDP